MATEPSFPELPVVAGLALLVIRGLLLWVVVPLAVASWLVGWPFWRRNGSSLGNLLGWADLNLIASIERSVLRPFVRKPLSWVTVNDIPNVDHEISFTDLA